MDKAIDIVSVNNEITKHARRKELYQAMKLYDNAYSQGYANSHTFSSAINANVRCGNIEGAEKVFEQMKSTKGIKLDVISCTTLMKGYCSEGNITNSLKLLKDMDNRNLLPNVRTINTFLRGCVMTGNLNEADNIIAKMQKDYKIIPDVSSWEYLITLQCQSLRLDKALPIIGRLKSDPNMVWGLGAMNVSIARASSILGEWKICSKALQSAKDAFKKEEELELIEKQNDIIKNSDDFNDIDYNDKIIKTNGKQQVTGGKKAWNTEKIDSQNRMESLELFREHKREELRQEIVLLETFIKSRMDNNDNNNLLKSIHYLQPYFRKALSFDPIGCTLKKESSIDAIVSELLQSVQIKFGLNSCLKPLIPNDIYENIFLKKKKPNDKFKNKKKRKADGSSNCEVTSQLDELIARSSLQCQSCSHLAVFSKALKMSFTDIGFINFPNLFGTIKASNDHGDNNNFEIIPSTRPVKIEIASGAGEWAVSQALADPASNWITLELRHDRVYQTFLRAICSGASNISVMGGDALNILPTRIAPSSVHNVFVNHPEPPQQQGGLDSQGKHMLNDEFFMDVSRILVMDGILTIVTDNLWYGKFLMRSISTISSSGLVSVDLQKKNSKKKDNDNKGEWNILEEQGGITLYVGKPGIESGHVADASSYFDRLWKRSSLEERYFLVLKKKSDPNPLYLRKDIAKANTVNGLNKKIKFDEI